MRTWRVIFRLSQTYSVNSTLYWLRKLPFLGKKIPASLYGNARLKRILTGLSYLRLLAGALIGKFLYVGVMILLPLSLMGKTEAFLHVFLVFTLVGGIVSENLLGADKEKYYAVQLMHVDAREYALQAWAEFLVYKGGFLLPALIVFGLASEGTPFWACLTGPVFVVAWKMAASGFLVAVYQKTGKRLEQNWKLVFFLWLLALGLGYGLPALGIAAGASVYAAALGAAVVLAAPGARHVWKWDGFGRLYKKILTPDVVFLGTGENTAQIQQKTYLSGVNEEQIKTEKKGYAYFNEVFVKRHRKILTRAAKRTAAVLLAAVLAALGAVLLFPEAGEAVNKIMMNSLPYFVFLLYLINRGNTMTKAMFFNCDHSMLAYRFYRQPESILGLFWERLKTVVRVNLLPALVLAAGLPVLLYCSGGTENPFDYLLLAVSVTAMSVFFSVHHLVLYYLLQPYNAGMQTKSYLYSAANAATYLVCYFCIRFQAPTTIFAAGVTAGCLIYAGAALWLVWRLAPKTFHLK